MLMLSCAVPTIARFDPFELSLKNSVRRFSFIHAIHHEENTRERKTHTKALVHSGLFSIPCAS